jgi:hypothetical protein
VDYTTLALAQVKAGLEAIATDAQATFGGLDARQLNWRPDATGGAWRSASSICSRRTA